MAALWRVYPKPMGGDHGLKKNRRLNDHLQRPLARNESFAYLCGFCYVQCVSGVKHFVTLVLKC